MLVSLLSLAWARCSAKSEDLAAALDAAEGAYLAMELEGFVAAMRAGDRVAACLDERPPRATIARLHRLHGLEAFATNPTRARAAFVSARLIEPRYAFPDDLVPAGHPVGELYAASMSDAAPLVSVPPASGSIFVDGREATARPSNRPVFVQILAADGSVSTSGYLWPEQAMLSYASAAEDFPTPAAAPPSAPRRAFYLEVAAGYGLGDVDRGYSQRVLIEATDFQTSSTASWNGPGEGGGAVVRLAGGFAPLWYLDLGGAIGAQWGNKYLDVAWTCPDCSVDGSDGGEVFEPVAAIRLLLEARARITPVKRGVVHPYVLAAFTAEVFDGIEVPDTGDLDYGDAEGGADLGLTGGLGLSVDLPPAVFLFIEVPYTRWLLQNERVDSSEQTEGEPAELESVGGTFRAVLGTGLRL